jgi:serine O-acetyltransferase
MNNISLRFIRFFNRFFARHYFGIRNSIAVRDSRMYFSCVASLRLPKSIHIPHPVGIVIGSDSIIGDNVTIMQNVTIGVRNLSETKSPKIGNNVFIGAGAVIVGDINIADDTYITANKVVNRDTFEGERI